MSGYPDPASLFSIQLHQGKRAVYLHLHVFSPYKTTRWYPATQQILAKHCPRVLKTQCFNDQHLCFQKEVRDTEIGHVFEHMVLQLLCEAECRHGLTSASHCGRTWWHTGVNTENRFRIAIYQATTSSAFLEALQEACRILTVILCSQRAIQVSPPAPAQIPELLQRIKDVPVIEAGLATPSNPSAVGATSCSPPPDRSSLLTSELT